MMQKIFLFVILASHVFCEPCVRYTFEEGFNELFDNKGVCAPMSFWNVGTYNSTDVTGHDEHSTTFITPLEGLSCVSSSMFTMTNGGRLEVLIYMEAKAITDQITVLANQYTGGEHDRIIGTAGYSPLHGNYVSGWHTLVVDLSSTGTSMCYVSIMGMAGPNSIILIDSIRYKPPNMDESLCQLYEEKPRRNQPNRIRRRGNK